MEGKFNGDSAYEYFLRASAKAIELLYQYFLKMRNGQGEVEKIEHKLLNVLISMDDYFYERSDAKKKVKICLRAEDSSQTATEIAENSKLHLPRLYVYGKFQS